MNHTPHEILKKYWGFDDFRPLQLDIIQSALSGKDTLALLPTGGGKSLCFQVPALCQEGICIVISPLIALMKDQVQNLKKRGISAVAIYSGMHHRQIDQTLDNCIYGKVKFLYVSPERLATPLAIERIRKMNVNLLAIDEAHCISQWGYDFRPPYLEIATMRDLHPTVPFLALTATATPKVVEDIQEKLAFRQKNVFQKSFARDNLTYVVLPEAQKFAKMLDILRKVQGTSVVYVRNRKGTKDVAQWLKKNGISADFYHAGLPNEERSRKQDDWINNKTRVMVATNAFGMGIDKPDVRTVVHLSLPDSLEAYFQEAGRGGRDGKRAFAILLYDEQDKLDLIENFERSFPEIAEIKRVYQALGSYFQLAVGSGEGESFDFELVRFCKAFGFQAAPAFSALKILMHEGWISLSEAVFVPSSLTVKATQAELYDFKLKNPAFDKLITTILRTYQGAFNHYVNINELQLASFLRLEPPRVRRALQSLEENGIIEYRPFKDMPQITFTKSRNDLSNLTIDQKRYDFLKKRQKQNIEAAINYATATQCRSQLLLAYFGEKNAPPCGKCDVCTHRHDTDLSAEQFLAYQNKIKTKLLDTPLNTRQLIAVFSSAAQPKVQAVLQKLLEQEQIAVNERNELYWSGKK